MKEHLPECPVGENMSRACICERLNRFELRVFADRSAWYEAAYANAIFDMRKVVAATRHEDACCSRGCACQTNRKAEPCDLICNCMVGSVVSEILYAIRRAYQEPEIPEPPEPNAKPDLVNRWSGRSVDRSK